VEQNVATAIVPAQRKVTAAHERDAVDGPPVAVKTAGSDRTLLYSTAGVLSLLILLAGVALVRWSTAYSPSAIALERAAAAPFMMEVSSARVFLSGDLHGGGCLLETRPNMADGRHLFRLLPATLPTFLAAALAAGSSSGALYRIQHQESGQLLAASKDVLNDRRFVQGTVQDAAHAYFWFESTSGELSSAYFRLRDEATGEYLYQSTEIKGGDPLVKTRAGMTESRSIFQLLDANGKPLAP
jgi:hypothetical protein